jgi:predicted DNA-binding antitoxin AbrB/MazE fold protein
VAKLSVQLDAWRKKVGADMKLKPASLSEGEKATANVVLTPEEAKKAEKKADKKEEKKAQRKTDKIQNQ